MGAGLVMCPTLHHFLMSMHGFTVWEEWDAQSYFYQFGVDPALSPYWCLRTPAGYKALVVLPQGWSWSPALAQTFSQVICTWAVRLFARRHPALAAAVLILSWIDNFVLLAKAQDGKTDQQILALLRVAFQDTVKSANLVVKLEDKPVLLNLELDLPHQQYRVSQEWCGGLVSYCKVLDRSRTVTAKKLWQMAGCFIYFVFASGLSFAMLRHTLKTLSVVSQAIHAGHQTWQGKHQAQARVIAEWCDLALHL